MVTTTNKTITHLYGNVETGILHMCVMHHCPLSAT